MSNFVSYQQSYGTYQQPYPIVYPSGSGAAPQLVQSATAHYPTRFPPPPPAAPGYQFNVQPPGQSTVAVAETIPSISPEIASKEVQRLILAQLKASDYDSIEPPALKRLEIEVVAFVQKLFERAHQYANLANRAIPIAKDMLLACEERDLRTKDLRAVAVEFAETAETTFELPPPRSQSPELLPSDDENAPPAVPGTLRQLPTHFPALPPKHTYLRTPASPPKKAALPSLERKLKTAGLVQESLKNLLTATEDNLGQEDGELLGHIVNWEASTYPRKRWKVSA
ncbi:hypothetical protein K503DRAFT_106049 [Rhizopogon vinicolor AM-OR11-026]|uniref:Transcription initiation factor TFIID subunit 8 n=1 Tax=Rhizopogon vinicolor AM-OR11-026 TaxID=1314800 RepID=A0A1B7N2U1_9AGAM|nr:hypothetical protein K503DRAFT_106049 [Rhizopogon vinicolor AM-OR11-026]